MTITDKQIDKLDSLIIEGIIALTSLQQGQKNYIDKVNDTIKGFCVENGEAIPEWIDLTIPPIYVGDEEQTKQSAKEYYPKLLPHLLSILRELQSQYYSRMQLDEIRKQTEESSRQTVEAQKQTKETQKANKWTKRALGISGVAVVVSIIAVCLSTCTRTIKIDETQFQEMKQHSLIDSIAKRDTLLSMTPYKTYSMIRLNPMIL